MKQNLKSSVSAFLCAGFLLFSPAAYADELSDAILKVLLKKGIVTEAEVREMKGELRQEAVNKAKKEVEGEQRLEQRVAKLEEGTPSWLKGTKFKGDFRLRNDVINDKPRAGKSLVRQRIRLRFGMDLDIHEKVKGGFRLATGSSSGATSANQTLDNAFDKKQVWVDQAWVSLRPLKGLEIRGGKMKNPFFRTDMLWDADINLEGVYAKYTCDSTSQKYFATAGYFPLEQLAYGVNDQKSIYLWAGQAGANLRFDDMKINVGLAYYKFAGLKGNTLGITGVRGTNTPYVKDWNIIIPTLALSMKDVLGDVDMGFFEEYANNRSVKSNNTAVRIGGWIGDGKVRKEGQWKMLLQHSNIMRDAFIDALPDADFVSGRTNAKGWEFIGNYALYDNVILTFDYYNTSELTTGAKHTVIQTDLSIKF